VKHDQLVQLQPSELAAQTGGDDVIYQDATAPTKLYVKGLTGKLIDNPVSVAASPAVQALVSGAWNLPIVLASSGTPVTVYSDNATESILARVVIPANTVPPDSVLSIRGLFAFSSAAGGKVLAIYFGATGVGYNFPSNAILGQQFEHILYVGPNRKTQGYLGFINNVTSPSDKQGQPFSASSSANSLAEVDFTVEQILTIKGYAPSASSITLAGWDASVSRSAAPTASVNPTNALACWGDSLTAGAGAVSPAGGWPTQVGIANVQRPVSNLGVGGETAAQIRARVLADTVRGTLWNCVFTMGRNNVGTGTFQADVLAELATCVANLSTAAKYIVGTVTNGAGEAVGSANWLAIQALNTAIIARYGSKVADVMSALTTGYTVQIPIAYRAATATTTATGTSGATTMTVASTTGIVNGQFVSGTGIPDQTTITISGSTVTLSQALTGNLSSTAVQFVGASEVHFNDAGYTVWKNTMQTALIANGM